MDNKFLCVMAGYDDNTGRYLFSFVREVNENYDGMFPYTYLTYIRKR